MICGLNGKLSEIGSNFLVIEVQGVYYKCFTDNFTLNNLHKDLGNQVRLYTYMNIREDDISLFAFLEENRIEWFKKLISVSGVGCKVALSILSEFSPEQIISFIVMSNSKAFTKASGLGNKLAQRIILELKDKIKADCGQNLCNDIAATKTNNIYAAVQALETLGYSENDVMPILSSFDSSMSVEKLIQCTLKQI